MPELSFDDAKIVAGHLNFTEIQKYISPKVLERAIRIRAVENTLLELFQTGKIGGTIHTCIGQELPPALIAEHLAADDFFTSNHRCHGHFIAKTENWKGLVLEILGSRDGVCRGIGSSQHLAAKGFLSNGPQGSLVPVGTGIAHQLKSETKGSVVFSFIGEGSLGEGIVYESFNLAMTTSSPQLFVCENNYYSQSTPQYSAVSGSILARAEAFGMKTFSCSIWQPEEISKVIGEAIDFVRNNQIPAFLLIQCYRLRAHSKGDDDRPEKEINYFQNRDPLSIALSNSTKLQGLYDNFVTEIKTFIDSQNPIIPLDFEEYAVDSLPKESNQQVPVSPNEKIRGIESVRQGIRSIVSAGGLIIGEDISDPYGGAFKATKGISSDFPENVISAPISEAAIIGFGIGTALCGRNVFVEIMFGDFVTYGMDQIISNASKFLNVYNLRDGLPIIIRMPNGGHRGYGPTHSQSLEKHLVGIDNVLVVASSSLRDSRELISELFNLKVPAIFIENKIGYSRFLFQNVNRLEISQADSPLGSTRFMSRKTAPDITLISYGEIARDIVDNLTGMEAQYKKTIECVNLVQLHPIRIEELLRNPLGHLVIVVEEGSKNFGIGSEIAALLAEHGCSPKKFRRVGAAPFPIASNLTLEEKMLANIDKVRQAIEVEIEHE